MKACKILVLLLLIPAATSAVAQCGTQPGPLCHIIIVVQENRTPDNLFGAGAPNNLHCGSQDDFESGVDIENGGYGYVYQDQNHQKVRELICNTPLALSGWDPNVGTNGRIVDPDHTYNSGPTNPWGWVADYDDGNMDGFCHEYDKPAFENVCPSYSYVPKSDVQPYFDIATNYGFANYMFQTNEGPSFPAHQFLFTGTSAPVAPGNNYDLDFVAELASSLDYGCQYSGTSPNWVNPHGDEFSKSNYAECYTHDSLVTAAADCNNGYCDRGISWGYYIPIARAIWDAPATIPEVCYGQNTNVGGPCPSGPGTEYGDHVHIAIPNGNLGAPIFDALYNCTLPAITWVIPDMHWSDHPIDPPFGGGPNSIAYGPSWVGDIINAVGGDACGGKYWNAEPTAIFVVWDDWGGWFDHVSPWAHYRGTWNGQSWDCSAPNSWGCGYVSGFRVPLLVVSPYTGTQIQGGGITGYVSGACGPTPLTSCPNFGLNDVYVHDFGSILAFTEWNFGFNPQFIAPPDYADYNAPDWSADHIQHVPLSDFFGLYPSQRSFVPITSVSEPYTFFQNYYQTTQTSPTGPDDDEISD